MRRRLRFQLRIAHLKVEPHRLESLARISDPVLHSSDLSLGISRIIAHAPNLVTHRQRIFDLQRVFLIDKAAANAGARMAAPRPRHVRTPDATR